MKVIILAGGFGTRLSEYTESIPKPMVSIGNIPIIRHIMNLYAHYGHDDFYLALGYKAEIIKNYFLNYKTLNSDFTVDLGSGQVSLLDGEGTLNWRVTLSQTGENSMTGGRLKRLKHLIGNESFMLTYGDGLADIDLNALLEFHKSHGKMVTVTAVRPSARFGELEINGGKVTNFKEKPQTSESWINGGFFVIEPAFFSLIKDDLTVLEKEPLELAASMGELMAYEHNGFWQCMDTKRDRDMLEDLWVNNKAKWKR